MRSGALNTLALVVGVLGLAAGGPWLIGQLRSLPEHRTLVARSGERVVTLDVGGMTCAGCAAKIRHELAGVEGVSAVAVRIQQERAFVVAPAAVPDSVLVGAVKRAGPGFAAAVVP